ncbi:MULTISPECIES: photosystem II protein Psb27 [Trichocoleus]|uniref:Photosystem II lipoprotein Psb27 n=1 Tax=Trichocoleus desertorum GB2-A4 TaxID=2933944 RepID=A0ABV0J5B8_9CYAN|nr:MULTISPECIES: photosystem II protein Psb27 [unclassified Trichocoleus]MBD1861592.1 photosystem II protein Psb27 [Trichocoleus sp. FACHB-46]MBD2098498.1 photosystem II protein Psb27 [Trichocoleus sp. FACHB-591]
MKRYLSRLLALILVVTVGLAGCSGDQLSGNYRQDTLTLVNSLRETIELPQDAPNRVSLQTEARQKINDFASRYRRDDSVTKLSSFTTMRTALNALAGHYSSYPNRPLPQKLRDRLQQELTQVETALNRGA